MRDEQSRQLLETMGLNKNAIEVVPDPVMGLELPAVPGTSSLPTEQPAGSAAVLKTVGISVRYWEESRRELDALAEGLRKACAKTPLHLRFLPFHHPVDNEASRYMLQKLEQDITQLGGTVSICEDALHPQQMLREVASCDGLIGMRLHSLIYAAGRRVPLMGVSYDPKIDHFLKRIYCSPVGSTVTLEGGMVADKLLQLLENGEAWKQEREPLIAALVEEAEAPARRIIEYFRRKG
ncbi:Polysaccharide pyruvyl transferase [compost metagenome]